MCAPDDEALQPSMDNEKHAGPRLVTPCMGAYRGVNRVKTSVDFWLFLLTITSSPYAHNLYTHKGDCEGCRDTDLTNEI